ncbi:hypothetical protein [Nocardia sp. NPDC004722]
MQVSSTIMTVETRHDRPVMVDPAVRYRPERIRGRRYLVTASAPRARIN